MPLPPRLLAAGGLDPEPADTRSLNPTAENVAVRAYYLFLERGLDGGNEIEDWLRADRELTA